MSDEQNKNGCPKCGSCNIAEVPIPGVEAVETAGAVVGTILCAVSGVICPILPFFVGLASLFGTGLAAGEIEERSDSPRWKCNYCLHQWR
jgi:hypothetical protein